MTRALGLVSGGLDSSLAVLALMRQHIEVTGIAFVTPFFGAEKAMLAAKKIGHPLIIADIGQTHLEMIKAPRYGYGRHLNPCIDCHALMYRLAGERMEKAGYDFLFSGEVLGQRPMSQNANALKSVAKLSGCGDRILRPLSARLLPITPMEEAGLVDREQLFDIQGRSRKRQQVLAREWGLNDYPPSAGGCLLTEAGFANQLRDLLQHHPAATLTDVELLKAGRQFRLSSTAKLVVGRNRADNETLKKLIAPGQVTMRCLNFSGPLGILSGSPTQEDLIHAAAVIASYGKGRDEEQVEILCEKNGKESILKVEPMPREQVGRMIVV